MESQISVSDVQISLQHSSANSFPSWPSLVSFLTPVAFKVSLCPWTPTTLNSHSPALDLQGAKRLSHAPFKTKTSKVVQQQEAQEGPQ